MAKENSSPSNSGPIIIEESGVRIWVDYRNGAGGDAGLTFDVTVGSGDSGARILRFDCFNKTPHYHIGAAGRDAAHDMKSEGIADPVRWTLEQIKTCLPSMVAQAGYDDLAKTIDQQAIARSLSKVEQEILAKI